MSETAIGWRRSSLGEIARVRRGASPRPINDPKWFADEGPGWVRIADVTRAGHYLRRTEQRLSRLGLEKSVRVGPGDIIMSIAGTIGRPAIVDMDACIHDGFVLFSDLDPRVDREFLYYFLGWKAGDFESRGQPGTQKNINTTIVGDTPIDLPPPAEQRKIATILSSIDDRIEKTERIVEQNQVLKRAMTRDLLARGVSGRHTSFKRTEIGEIPEDWTLVSLVDVTAISARQVDPRSPSYENLPLVAPNHVESGTGRLLSVETASAQRAISGKYLFDDGCVVYSKIRPRLRKAWLATFPGLCSADMYPLTPSPELIPEFLLVLLLGENFSRFAEAASGRTGIPKINRDDLAKFRFALPPTDEQVEIGRALASIDSRVIAETEVLEQCRSAMSALASALLSGELRVNLDEVVA